MGLPNVSLPRLMTLLFSCLFEKDMMKKKNDKNHWHFKRRIDKFYFKVNQSRSLDRDATTTPPIPFEMATGTFKIEIHIFKGLFFIFVLQLIFPSFSTDFW